MATKFVYGCPNCGRRMFGPVGPLEPDAISLPENRCCDRSWDFDDCARFQWDAMTEMRVQSVLTEEEQMNELRRSPKEAAEKYAQLMMERRRGRIECDESTKPMTLKWVGC
jgi:hypothetical protein